MIDHPIEHIFNRPRQLGQYAGFHHTTTAFERVECAANFSLGFMVSVVLLPGGGEFGESFEYFTRFFDENFHQLGVHLVFFNNFSSGAKLRRRAICLQLLVQRCSINNCALILLVLQQLAGTCLLCRVIAISWQRIRVITQGAQALFSNIQDAVAAITVVLSETFKVIIDTGDHVGECV